MTSQLPLSQTHLTSMITDALTDLQGNPFSQLFSETDLNTASVVLFLLGMHPLEGNGYETPCLILNKRSSRVTQPGDLCCPGGGISPKADALVARLVRTGSSTLTRWPGWQPLNAAHPSDARRLSVFFATALREGLEEMRLNPLRVRFLGPLAPQSLILFRRVIFPMACWLESWQRFYPNWEVDTIIPIPIGTLLDHSRYGIYRVRMEQKGLVSWKDFPCFIHDSREGREILWGATFRITLDFLKLVFGFSFPESNRLPVFFGNLNRRYLKGSKR